MSTSVSRFALLARTAGGAWLSPLLATALAGADASAPSGSEPAIPLEVMAISATRTPQDIRTLPHSVSLLELSALDDRQIEDLRTALAAAPGVVVANTGAAGGSSAVFLRGASSHQVSLLVDGVRMNDRSAAHSSFLGGADLAGLDRFEILRGPQSTLYGSSAMGGVVLLETTHGNARNAGARVSALAGSFGTWGGTVAGRGALGRAGFSASLSRLVTDNDRPDNRFEVVNASARLEGRPLDRLLVGGTVRWQDSDYEEPGSRLFPFPGFIAFENLLVTGYAEWQAREDFLSRVTIGRHLRDYHFTDDFNDTRTRNFRTILDWQNTWQAARTLELVGGFNYESAEMRINDLRSQDDLAAGYLAATWRPRNDVVLNAGLRHDEFDAVGGATTGRAGVAWLLDDGRTKLRATLGTGFTAPGTDDRFGVALWGQLPNPEIRPEKCAGWDVGIDRDFNDGRLLVSATWFHNRYRNLFEYEIVDFDTFEGMVVNRARATTRGAELAVRWRPLLAVDTTLAYTWLDATNDDTGERLIRRPRHTVDLDVHWRASTAWSLGAGVHVVADRFDTTDVGNARIEDYATVRLHASYAIRPELRLKLRVENALDEEYDEVFGYAALPRGFFGSVEWIF